MPDEWQARIVDISGLAPFHFNEIRERMGAEGWEAVGFDSTRLLLKRPAAGRERMVSCDTASPETKETHEPT